MNQENAVWTNGPAAADGTAGPAEPLWTALNGVPITPDMLRCHA